MNVFWKLSCCQLLHSRESLVSLCLFESLFVLYLIFYSGSKILAKRVYTICIKGKQDLKVADTKTWLSVLPQNVWCQELIM